MARLSDMPDWERESHLARARALPDFGPTPWAPGVPLAQRRVAIITTAGLQVRSDSPFVPAAADYRVLPADTPAGEIVMSHTSVNFDRSGFQEDLNVVFPLERLRELERDRVIGSVAAIHYSFMGAVPIQTLEPKAREIAALLKQDRVDAVLLTPV